LGYFITSTDQLIYTKVSAAFITLCIEEGPDHEDFEHLKDLANKFEYDFEYDALQEIKTGVENFWQDQVDEMILRDEVLEQYLDPRDSDVAFNTLCDYLSDKLFFFDFTDDEVRYIAEYADIEAQIESNQYAAGQDDHEYDSRSELAGHSPQSEDSQINDLFDRD
jgi:hypothetical protein